MSVLVDTNIIINALRGIEPEIDALNALSIEGLSTSIITLGELYHGAFRTRDPQRQLIVVRDFLAEYAILGLSEPIMEQFGQIRAELHRQGNPIENFDLLIGATAVAYGMSLLTRNVRHFSRIPGLHIHPILND